MNDTALFQHWNLNDVERCPDLTVSGSPNRSVARFVFRSGEGVRFIAEGFALSKKNKQITQNTLLEFLRANGMASVHPYLRTKSGSHGVESDSCFWQIRPWLPADEPDRDTLGDHTARAVLWADVLTQFKKIALLPGLPPPPNPRFFFGNKLPSLERFMKQRMPSLRSAFCRVLRDLDDFLNREQDLPAALAHGDFHPGNILIRDGAVSAVIDWEFAGKKTAGYDLALLVGCLGRDRADWLYGEAVSCLRARLVKENYLEQPQWRYFPDLVAAIRLGWLGEWIDLEEEDLAAQELDFINSHLSMFREAWRASC